MEIIRQQVPDSYKLSFLGDKQIGNIAFSESKFLEVRERILSEQYNYVIDMGDAIEAFWVNDPRYNFQSHKITVAEQKKTDNELLLPLVQEGRLIGKLIGNHEWKVMNSYGDIVKEQCEDLQKDSNSELPHYAGYSAKFELVDSFGIQFKVYTTHGRKQVSSVSPDKHRRRAYLQFRLKRLLEDMAGDCIIMARAHSHIVLVTPPIPTVYLTNEDDELVQHYTKAGIGASEDYIPPDERWYLCSGSFLRSQYINIVTYTEVLELPPVELGYCEAIIEDRKVVDVREVKI